MSAYQMYAASNPRGDDRESEEEGDERILEDNRGRRDE